MIPLKWCTLFQGIFFGLLVARSFEFSDSHKSGLQSLGALRNFFVAKHRGLVWPMDVGRMGFFQHGGTTSSCLIHLFESARLASSLIAVWSLKQLSLFTGVGVSLDWSGSRYSPSSFSWISLMDSYSSGGSWVTTILRWFAKLVTFSSSKSSCLDYSTTNSIRKLFHLMSVLTSSLMFTL